MDYKRIGFGLGLFSIALGAVELIGAKRVTRALGVEGKEGVVKGFGGRELLAGATLVAAPAVATGMWNRVAGDAMDLAALGLAARRGGGRKAWWGAVAFVAGATLIDVVVARGLGRQTGKTFPTRDAADEPADRAKPTSIEPAHTAHALAPAVG